MAVSAPVPSSPQPAPKILKSQRNTRWPEKGQSAPPGKSRKNSFQCLPPVRRGSVWCCSNGCEFEDSGAARKIQHAHFPAKGQQSDLRPHAAILVIFDFGIVVSNSGECCCLPRWSSGSPRGNGSLRARRAIGNCRLGAGCTPRGKRVFHGADPGGIERSAPSLNCEPRIDFPGVDRPVRLHIATIGMPEKVRRW